LEHEQRVPDVLLLRYAMLGQEFIAPLQGGRLEAQRVVAPPFEPAVKRFRLGMQIEPKEPPPQGQV